MEKKNNDYTELYKGITRLVKTKEHDEDVWFAVQDGLSSFQGIYPKGTPAHSLTCKT